MNACTTSGTTVVIPLLCTKAEKKTAIFLYFVGPIYRRNRGRAYSLPLLIQAVVRQDTPLSKPLQSMLVMLYSIGTCRGDHVLDKSALYAVALPAYSIVGATLAAFCLGDRYALQFGWDQEG